MLPGEHSERVWVAVAGGLQDELAKEKETRQEMRLLFSSPVPRLRERLLEPRGDLAAGQGLVVLGGESRTGWPGQVSSSEVAGPGGPKPRHDGLWWERN